MWRTDSLERTLMLGDPEALVLQKVGEGDNRRWDSWMASPTWQTWVWASSGSWWWIGKPSVLQSMGSRRVRHDLESEQQKMCPLAQILHSSWDATYPVKSFVSIIPTISHLCLLSISAGLISGCLLTPAPSTSQAKCLCKVHILNDKAHAGRILLPVISASSPCSPEWLIMCTDGYESESHSVVSDSLGPHGLHRPRNSPGQNTGVGSRFLLQGIFPTQGSNPGLLHCRQMQLSYQGSPDVHRVGI